MTIRLAEACINNMNTTAETATTETMTTNLLAQVDMAAVNACINNSKIPLYLQAIENYDNDILGGGSPTQIQQWGAAANKYQQMLQALQTGNQQTEQQWDQLPQAGQTLVSNDNNAVAQMASIMQSVNQGPGYLSNLMAGAL